MFAFYKAGKLRPISSFKTNTTSTTKLLTFEDIYLFLHFKMQFESSPGPIIWGN